MSNGTNRPGAHCRAMSDWLFTRAELAIQESRLLQSHRRASLAQHVQEREQLRITTFKSAMYRSETRAMRENREN